MSKQTVSSTIPEEINTVAKQYGYYIELNQDTNVNVLHRQSDKKPLLHVDIKRGRLRILHPTTDALYFSGPVKPSAIADFLEKFYYAQKITEKNEVLA